MGINLAKIQATREAEAKDAELQKAVETKRAAMQLEKRRATDVVQSKIERESAQEKADAKLYAENKNADGHLYKQKQDADAKYLVTVKGADALVYQKKQEAEADYYQTTKEAEALFYAKKKEAEGIAEMAKAYERLAAVLGGPQGLIQYMMIQDGTYEKLAKLTPKLSIICNLKLPSGTLVSMRVELIRLHLSGIFCKACHHYCVRSMIRLESSLRAGWQRCRNKSCRPVRLLSTRRIRE